MTKIVTIGGGTGTYNVLTALKKFNNVSISAIVSMSDDGGSSGRLRDEYGVLPSGDIRRAIVALSNPEKTEILRKLFNYRFSGGGLSGHNLGNLITMALEGISGDYGKTVDLLEEIFDINGKVYPVTFEKTRLLAKLEDGSYVLGESNIDIPKHDGNLKINQLYVIKEDYGKILKKIMEEDMNIQKSIFENLVNKFLEDLPSPNPKIESVINQADYIIVGPGDLYTSILPNLIVGNVGKVLVKSKAKKIFISNLFTKFGETNNFKLSDFINILEFYLGKDIFDYILVHDRQKYPIDNKIISNYKKEKKLKVEINGKDKRIIKSDFVKQYDMARHSSKKIFTVLSSLLRIKE